MCYLCSRTQNPHMLSIKKLDLYILKKFLPLFAAAFFICLFVFMMQFTWRYVDELIGKGLSFEILAQFFWYMGITLIPTSLPLAVLLATLIAFGNMGEQLELLSMKAAGVSLIRIMRPLMIVTVFITGISFYFQNKTSPEAQVKLKTLLISMKQSSPAVEIPEGVFYSGIPNVNIYVEKKNAPTGMLYQLIIYKTDQGFDRAQIVLADSGRVEITEDKMHLKLALWQGEQFENLQSQNFASVKGKNVPYDRETFQYKELIIDFDSNFNMMDAEMLRNTPSAKNMQQIAESVDSMNLELDSIGMQNYEEAKARWFKTPQLNKADSAKMAQRYRTAPIDFDKLVAQTPIEDLQTALYNAKNTALSYSSELEWKSIPTDEGNRRVRWHWVEWHTKITLSLGCLLFFFIGAPLGAIIRKGGLGMPTVISVIIFIFYYIINTSGMKMARDGSWNMVFGMWISSAILLPFGVFLTYKSNKDSVVFNGDLYLAILRRFLGLRSSRHILRKDVIIEDPDYSRCYQEVTAICQLCNDYNSSNRLYLAPNYIKTFFLHREDHTIEELEQRLESFVEEMSNTKDPKILQALNALPVIFSHAHVSPFHGKKLNIAAGILLPFGALLWIRIWRFRLRLFRDLKQIVKCCDTLAPEIKNHIQEQTLK